jgi:nicotinamide riboside kinase
VVLVGAESTGKTTLAQDLCARLRARGGAWGRTRWVPEHGRDYTVEKLAREGGPDARMDALVWTTADFVAIAREQNALEARAARGTGPVLLCDTDALATAVWHERYLGARAPEVEALAIDEPSLYLLTHDDDVAFEADAIRDGERFRAWMTETFVDRLHGTAHRLVLVRGSREKRVSAAARAIDAWLAGIAAPPS